MKTQRQIIQEKRGEYTRKRGLRLAMMRKSGWQRPLWTGPMVTVRRRTNILDIFKGQPVETETKKIGWLARAWKYVRSLFNM